MASCSICSVDGLFRGTGMTGNSGTEWGIMHENNEVKYTMYDLSLACMYTILGKIYFGKCVDIGYRDKR